MGRPQPRAARAALCCAVAAALLATTSVAAKASPCTGDRDGDESVTVDEIVAIADDVLASGTFPAIAIDTLVAAVRAAIHGCGSQQARGCNGADHLCARRYDEVAYATTHNAMANADDRFQVPNQRRSVTVQLEDGVRALMLDTYRYEGDLFLCHTECALLGRRLLTDGLAEIRAFLERNPREVVTIIFESYIDAAETESAFSQSGLLDHAHAQDPNEPWPTLGEFIESGRRLVVLTDRRADPAIYPWYHYVWDYAFETPFSFERPADFSCQPNRGNPSNGLFILNHFLTQSFGLPRLAMQVNFNPLLRDRARECRIANDRLANFVTVDFYDIGDVLAVVNELNQ